MHWNTPKFQLEERVVFTCADRQSLCGQILQLRHCKDENQKRTIQYFIKPENVDFPCLWVFEKFISFQESDTARNETRSTQENAKYEIMHRAEASISEEEGSNLASRIKSSASTVAASEQTYSETESFTAVSPVSSKTELRTVRSAKSQRKRQTRKELRLKLPGNLCKKLDEDKVLVKKHTKICKLPASPNVIVILESFLKNFAVNLIIKTPDKTRTGSKDLTILERVNLCKEFIDNIRIMFDFTLETSLLYKEEDCQWETFKSLEPAAIANGYREEHPVQLKQEICCESADAEDHDTMPISNLLKKRKKESLVSNVGPLAKRNIVPVKLESDSKRLSGSFQRNNHILHDPRLSALTALGECKLLEDVNNWSLVPETAYSQKPVYPSLIYGVTHLIRLLAIMPEILSDMGLSEEKWIVVKSYSEALLEYISSQTSLLSKVNEERI